MSLANQSATPGRTTLLEAVNILLANIGEAPVNSLANEQVTEAWMAERTLLETHKEGQQGGWSWNSEQSYPFQRDVSTGEIVVPANVVKFSPSPYEWAGRFVLRGQRVYDREERSFEIDPLVTQIEADVVMLLSWDECPEAFNRWTTIKAARVFSDRVLSSDSIFRYTSKDEADALAELKRIELLQENSNMLTGGPGLRPFPTYSPGLGLLRQPMGGRVIG